MNIVLLVILVANALISYKAFNVLLSSENTIILISLRQQFRMFSSDFTCRFDAFAFQYVYALYVLLGFVINSVGAMYFCFIFILEV